MLQKAMALLAALSVMAAAQKAEAKKVYLNGIDLSSYVLVNVTLKCVTVRFDAKGNIYIDAPDYKIMPKGKPTKEVASDPMAKNVYVTTFPSGTAPFDLEVWVNGKMVRRVYASEGQNVFEITRYLRTGKNQVMLVFLRNGKRGRGSMRVIVGRGYESKGTVIIRKRLLNVVKGSKDAKSSYTVRLTVVK